MALAINFMKIGKLEPAVNKFNTILLLNPDNYEIREKLIDVKLQNKKYNDSVNHLTYLIKQFPENEKYKDLLGTVLIKLQEFREAITIYESLVMQNPNNQKSLKKLIGLYGKTGELHKANNLMQTIS